MLLRSTRSVCPVCLQPLPAALIQREEGVYMEKECPEHGFFSAPVWHNRVNRAFYANRIPPLGEKEGLRCPAACGICREHKSGTCCALLEITNRCNLRCRFCFAEGGAKNEREKSTEELELAIACLLELGHRPTLQLSGGEPTLREDLPELIQFAKSLGAPFIQLNTNGIRLAEEPGYAAALKEAGLSYVFLQFDGTEEEIYRRLRGRPLLAVKEKTIESCAACRLGVALVPTVVRGVNAHNLGDIVRFGLAHAPAVRGVHFQPVSYFGRCPGERPERYTLDDLIADVAEQTGIPAERFTPSHCDHPLCGFHLGGMVLPDGRFLPLGRETDRGKTDAAQNRDYVGRHWVRPNTDAETTALFSRDGSFDLEAFAARAESHSFTLTAMAFQDAGNLDIERLRHCSLHVWKNNRLMPFCAAYLSPLT